MPWRRKPANWLEYWEGPVNRDAGFKTVIVYCVGPADLRGSYHNGCHHNASLRLDDLPDWDWRDISAHLRCTKCGAVGYVDTRLNWSEVINFNQPAFPKSRPNDARIQHRCESPEADLVAQNRSCRAGQTSACAVVANVEKWPYNQRDSQIKPRGHGQS